MSFDKFIQNRTIAKTDLVTAGSYEFPKYRLSSFIEFETDGFLVGIQFMSAHNQTGTGAGSNNPDLPVGTFIAKVSADDISIPAGGNITNYSGAQILISHLATPDTSGTNSLHSDSRQTTIAYDADSKRIPIKSNDKLGVYICGNGANNDVQFHYTLTAYFVRS
jgi:hypothetical protein